MLRKNTIAFFNFVIDMISTLIDQCLNRSRENGASDEDYGITYRPYGIDKELAKPSDLDDYSFNEIRNNSVDHTTLVREKRARKVDDEMSASVVVIARSMHREMSLMDEMNAHEELMSRKESEDAFFNHRYIAPRAIDSKIITRNINALYIGIKPMINRPVARTRRRQRAVFHCAMLCADRSMVHHTKTAVWRHSGVKKAPDFSEVFFMFAPILF